VWRWVESGISYGAVNRLKATGLIQQRRGLGDDVGVGEFALDRSGYDWTVGPDTQGQQTLLDIGFWSATHRDTGRADAAGYDVGAGDTEHHG